MTMIVDRPVAATTTPDISALFDTPDAFRQWLDQFSPIRIVGIAGDGGTCPLAMWLKDVGYSGVDVDIDVVYLSSGAAYDLPEWARVFISSIDSSVDAFDDYQHRRARETKEVLRRVTSELGLISE